MKATLFGIIACLLWTSLASALQPGDPAPSFSLRDSEGNQFFLSQHVGKNCRGGTKGLLLNFFASHCPPCRKELPILNALVGEWKPQGIQVVIIGYLEDFDRIEEMLQEIQVDKPIILSDKYGKVGEKYGVRFLPTTFLIGSDGRIKEIIRGELPNFRDALREKVRALK